MENKKDETEKMFYSIGEVAGIVEEETSLVRFWANHFSKIIKPARNKKGDRLFSQQDVETIKLIHFLVRQKGMKLDGAYRRIIENREGTVKSMQIIQKLEDIKQQLIDVKDSI